MPKVSVYLPDDLHDEVRRRGLSLSGLTQAAVREAIAKDELSAWLETMRDRLRDGPRSPGEPPIEDVMAEVADEFGA